MSFVGMDTFEAFEAYLEVLPEGTDWASVAAGVMEAKATFPRLGVGMLTWVVGLGFGAALHIVTNFMVLWHSIRCGQFWFFRMNGGVIVSNVRVVISVLIVLVGSTVVVNGFNHAMAQSGLISYDRTLFDMLHRYVWLWTTFCVYVHSCFVHLYLSHRPTESASPGFAGGRLIVVALNASLLIVPLGVPIAQMVLIVGNNEAWNRARKRAGLLAAELRSRSSSAPASSWNSSDLEGQARAVFADLHRAHFLYEAHIILWVVGVALLLAVFFYPFLHHSNSLLQLIGYRAKNAKSAKTAREVTRILLGGEPGPTPSPTEQRRTARDVLESEPMGIRIRQNSASLLFMVSGSYVLGVGFLALSSVNVRQNFESSKLWDFNYLNGSLLILLMGLGLDFLYLWPPIAWWLLDYSIEHEERSRCFRTDEAGNDASELNASGLGGLSGGASVLEMNVLAEPDRLAPPVDGRRSPSDVDQSDVSDRSTSGLLGTTEACTANA